MAAAAPEPPRLTATYASPASPPFAVSEALPALPAAGAPGAAAAPDVAQKTAYLRRLRGAVAAAQEHVNRELTRRMDEDAARAAAAGQARAGGEDEDEDNYGEEAQGEDEA